MGRTWLWRWGCLLYWKGICRWQPGTVSRFLSWLHDFTLVIQSCCCICWNNNSIPPFLPFAPRRTSEGQMNMCFLNLCTNFSSFWISNAVIFFFLYVFLGWRYFFPSVLSFFFNFFDKSVLTFAIFLKILLKWLYWFSINVMKKIQPMTFKSNSWIEENIEMIELQLSFKKQWEF